METNDLQNPLNISESDLDLTSSTNELVLNTSISEQENAEPIVENENLPDDNEIKNTEVVASLDETLEKTTNESETLIKDIEESEKTEIRKDFENLSSEELVDILEKLVESNDINDIKTDVALIKVAFLKKEKAVKEEKLKLFVEQGGKKEEFDFPESALMGRFNTAFTIYKDKRNQQNEVLEKEKQENLTKKVAILEELKQLIESEEELKKTYDAFKHLQEKWKEIGQVPRTEINNLWQNYNFLVEKFFDKVKINNELKDLDLKKNLEAKVEICEKAEELFLEPSVTKAFQQLQKYHEMWREIGPVPIDKKDEVWERFRSSTEKINERRSEYYEKIKEEQNSNYETKLALCEKAEQATETVIATTKEWLEKTQVLNDMMHVWKTIGPAQKKDNDIVWMRFKTAIDNFFNTKKEFFDKLKDEQINNYNIKLNLCLQAESYKDSNNWKKATEDLIRLQQEWKKIGPVPKKYSDKIWKRFRAACDEFFNNKSSYFSNIDSKEEENLTLKKELIEKVKAYQFGENNNENLQIIKDFQRQWMELGHVPIKVKNEIQNEFRAAINEHFDRLKINSVEKNTFTFKSRVENLMASPQSNQMLSKERMFLTSKITSLKNDIKLWENNIGFFANSKKADVLKEEFLKKIENGKEEILILEAKLKVLKEAK
jgi:hypothetical protein